MIKHIETKHPEAYSEYENKVKKASTKKQPLLTSGEFKLKELPQEKIAELLELLAIISLQICDLFLL